MFICSFIWYTIVRYLRLNERYPVRCDDEELIKNYMHGLKFNIASTLFLLLATGMLLTNAVVTTFWQHSLVTVITENQKNSLSALAHFSTSDVHIINNYIDTLKEKTPGTCGTTLYDNIWQDTPSSNCEISLKLRRAIEEAAVEKKPVTTIDGNGAFFLGTQKRHLHVAVPLVANHVSGAFGITYPLPSIWEQLHNNQKIILVYILVNTIVLSVVGFFRLAAIILRPLDRLVEETSNYSGEENLAFVSENEGSEYRQLSTAINSMIQRIDKDKINLNNTILSLKKANETIRATQQEMIRAEKLASVGRLSAGLAHEIGNPLGIVLGYLGLLKQDKTVPEERLEYIQRSELELNRINMLVRQLLDFSRPLPTTSEPVHIHSLLLELQQMLQTQEENRDISFETRLLAEHDIVHGSRETLHQAFINLFLNALDAIHETKRSEQGIILIESKNIKNTSGKNMLRVIITDNGSGISPAHLKNIFDPFYSTKDPGKGTGLGLSVSHTIIENAGGTINAQSIEGQSTSITVELPTINRS